MRKRYRRVKKEKLGQGLKKRGRKKAGRATWVGESFGGVVDWVVFQEGGQVGGIGFVYEGQVNKMTGDSITKVKEPKKKCS